MAEFPFKPFAVGNLCSACCEDCIRTLNDPDAKCCKSLGPGATTKECYRPQDCKECKTVSEDPLVKKVKNYCTDPDGVYAPEGKTSCCFGECYDNRCYKCTGTKNNYKVEPLFDLDIEGCCDGVIYKKLECKECEDKKVVTTCKDPAKPDCCNGSGDCYKNGLCDSCDSLSPPENKRTAKIQNECKDNTDNPDCCGGTCWNAAKNKCKTCKDETTLIDKPNCGECCGPNSSGISICCETQKCCSITNECYDPKCSECG